MSKVTIQGDASGTGIFTIASPNSNTDRTLTLPDEAGTVLTTAGVPASAMPAGSVIQVVQSEQTIARFATTSTSYVDTGFFVNITPTSASSKILVCYNAAVYGASSYGYSVLYRDNTTLLGNTWSEGLAYVGYQAWGSVSWMQLDSPATTSQVKYSIYGKTSGGTVFFGSNSSTGTNSMVMLTAMEIAA